MAKIKHEIERVKNTLMLLVLAIPWALAIMSALFAAVGMERLGNGFSWLAGKVIDLVCEEH